MPQSLSRVLIHLVFSTKNRAPSLLPSVQTELHAYLAGVLKGVDCPTLQAGGVDDHVHLLFGLSCTRSTSEVVETVKTSSSKWIKTKGAPFVGFHWQAGYGAFSVSQSEAETVVTGSVYALRTRQIYPPQNTRRPAHVKPTVVNLNYLQDCASSHFGDDWEFWSRTRPNTQHFGGDANNSRRSWPRQCARGRKSIEADQ